jgi:hypothetical protein
MDRLFSKERLIRTELTTLIGLMAKKPLNLGPKMPEVVQGYVKRTDALMGFRAQTGGICPIR